MLASCVAVPRAGSASYNLNHHGSCILSTEELLKGQKLGLSLPLSLVRRSYDNHSSGYPPTPPQKSFCKLGSGGKSL